MSGAPTVRPARAQRLGRFAPAGGRPRRRRPWARLATAVAFVAAVTGCSETSPQWSPVSLPGDAVPVTVTAFHEELLVGTSSKGTPGVPGLVRLRGDQRTALPVTPVSGYGAEARWLSMAVDGAGALVAVGGARGGAHANVRWTVWRGETGTGLTEHPQTFETFGGWGAGDLVGAVALSSGPVLVGSWESRRAGLDAAVWLPSGPTTWARRSSAGTALESTPEELVGVVSAAPDGSRILLSGSLLRLGDGSVRRLPAVWRSEAGVAGWARLLLPGAGGGGEAAGAACSSGTCTVLGRVDGRLAVWRLAAHVQRLDSVPEVPVADADPLPPPAPSAAGLLVAVPDGAGSRLLREDGDGWTSLPGPPGRVRALAVVGAVAYAVATEGDAVDGLWAAHL